MARTIQDQRGIDRIRSCVGDPLSSFLAYQEAAAAFSGNAGPHVFGEETMAFLRRVYSGTG
jgi:hypothetical protein